MRPGPGLVVMVLAFLTGARPTNTFSSRDDFDRRPPLLLSALSPKPSLPLPAPTTTASSSTTITATYPPRAADALDSVRQFLSSSGLAKRNAPSQEQTADHVDIRTSYQQLEHRTWLRPHKQQLPLTHSLFSDLFNYPHSNKQGSAIDSEYLEKPSLTERSDPLVAASQIKAVDDDQGILGRINPWLSACDLAQPSTAPDLQGQCTAGKLPVAWVDEGPGPPVCPESCGMFKEQSNYEKLFNLNVVNSPSMDNNSTISGDSRKLTRDSRKTTNKRGRGDMCDDIRNPTEHRAALDRAKITTTNAIQIPEQTKENPSTMESREEQKQKTTIPCLDCLGDSKSTRPDQICRSANIKLELQRLRLRHCCERDLYTALHGKALDHALGGGTKCVEVLTDLMQTDALATRITCEFTEILVRYDCRQMYSIIHHCEDCKEAYRRWVCSTLIPYFDYVERDRPPNYKDQEISPLVKRNAPQLTAETATTMESKMTIDDSSSDTKKRSRRKSNAEKIRTRIRPCLSVCQTVEQKCPYLLPGDRAPAHPTQYAGEPTFLCLDPNIPETGDQMLKSNHGPDSCCYEYCENNRICARCNWTALELGSKSTGVILGESNSEIEADATPDYYRDNSYPENNNTAQCPVIFVPASDGISTVRTSVLPNTKCPIPYYIGDLPQKTHLLSPTGNSSGHRSQLSVYVLFAWLLLLAIFVLDVSPQHILSLLMDTANHIDLRATRPKTAGNRRCWLISWCASPKNISFSELPLLLFSLATTCWWHSELFHSVIKSCGTLKCQLLLFRKLHLISKYYLIRDLTTLTRNTALKPPPLLLLERPLLQTKSSQLWQRDTRATCQRNMETGSGRRSNSNAKTVIRWGTIVVVSMSRSLVCHRTSYTRITNFWALLQNLLITSRRVFVHRARLRIRLVWKRLVWIYDWLTGIKPSGLGIRLVPFRASNRRPALNSASNKTGSREGNSLGLITKTET